MSSYHYQDQHNDYADPFAVPAPQQAGSDKLGYDFSQGDERPYSDLMRGNSKNSGQYSLAGDPFHTRSYSTSKPPPFLEDASDADLARNAGNPATYQDLEFAEPHAAREPVPLVQEVESGPLSRFLANGKYPLEQRIENKKRGIGRQRYPFVVYTLTLVMTCVLIYELVLNAKQQGGPFSFKPIVNPMLGPSSSELIFVGARFPPCMKLVEAIPPSTQFGCLNNTANPATSLCSLEDLCHFGGFHGKEPNQWFRFITPIFVHAGLIHLLLNMFGQLSLSGQIEREMGSGGFLITYFAAGIFGNVLGGNFALVGIPSLGASGAIFGTLAVTWVDLIGNWKFQYRPVRKLIFMTVELVIGFALGFIPFVDNFAHLGGFFMGLISGTVFYPIISTTKLHRTVTWVFRLSAIPLAVILYVVLVRNFYTSDPYAACSGCRYLSCFPMALNNYCKGTGLTTY